MCLLYWCHINVSILPYLNVGLSTCWMWCQRTHRTFRIVVCDTTGHHCSQQHWVLLLRQYLRAQLNNWLRLLKRSTSVLSPWYTQYKHGAASAATRKSHARTWHCCAAICWTEVMPYSVTIPSNECLQFHVPRKESHETGRENMKSNY